MNSRKQVFEEIVLPNPEYKPDALASAYGLSMIFFGLLSSVVIEVILFILTVATGSFPVAFLILQVICFPLFVAGSIGFALGFNRIRLRRGSWSDIILEKEGVKINSGTDQEAAYLYQQEIESIAMGIHKRREPTTSSFRARYTYFLKMHIKPRNKKKIVLRTIIHRNHEKVIQKDKENFTKFITENYNIKPAEIDHINRGKIIKMVFLSLIPTVITVGICLLLYFL